MTKISNVEADLGQFKTDSGNRFDRLEKSMESLQIEAEKRHAALRTEAETRHNELLKLLSTQARSAAAPGPLSRPPTATPNTAMPTIPQTAATIPLTAPFSQNDLPPPFAYIYPPPTTGIHTTQIPVSAMPNDGSSHPHHSRPPPTHTLPPVNFDTASYADMGYFMGDSGPNRGPGPSADRHWLSGPDYRLRKLKMPLFDGTDAFGWVYRLERYFDIQGFVTSGEKLRTAVLCMEGQALAWYRWAEGRLPFNNWEAFKQQLLERFQPDHEGDIYEQFLTIKQDGAVRDYIGNFETLAAQLIGIPERVMESTFIKGLKPEIRASVRLLQPAGLSHTIRTAMLVEGSRTGVHPEPPRPGPRQTQQQPLRPFAAGHRPLPAAPNEPPRPVTGLLKAPYKRMTDSEYADKRAKGLCFR